LRWKRRLSKVNIGEWLDQQPRDLVLILAIRLEEDLTAIEPTVLSQEIQAAAEMLVDAQSALEMVDLSLQQRLDEANRYRWMLKRQKAELEQFFSVSDSSLSKSTPQ